MNQRVVYFVALVCIAQLGVTLVRNFWSEQSRQVQHVSLSRSSGYRNLLKAGQDTQRGDRSASAPSTASPALKKAKAAKEPPVPVKDAPAPDGSANAKAAVENKAPAQDVLEQPRNPVQEVTKALLPSPKADQTGPLEVTQVAAQSPPNPFVPFFSIRKDSSDTGKGSLTDYDLNELKVTAIISDSRGAHLASVETPKGRDFIVKVGTVLGAHGGRVIAISSAKLVVAEPYRSSSGVAAVQERELALKVPQVPEGLVSRQ